MLIKTGSGQEHEISVGDRVGALIDKLSNSNFGNSKFGNVIAIRPDQESAEVLWDARVNGPDSFVGVHRPDEIWACGSPIVPQTTSDKFFTAAGIIIFVPIALGLIVGIAWNILLPIAGLAFLLCVVLAVRYGPAILFFWLLEKVLDAWRAIVRKGRSNK